MQTFPAMLSLPYYQHPHQRNTSVLISEPSWAHCNHPDPWCALGMFRGLAQICLLCIYHRGSIQIVGYPGIMLQKS